MKPKLRQEPRIRAGRRLALATVSNLAADSINSAKGPGAIKTAPSPTALLSLGQPSP